MLLNVSGGYLQPAKQRGQATALGEYLGFAFVFLNDQLPGGEGGNAE
jgi:hypothetical protein